MELPVRAQGCRPGWGSWGRGGLQALKTQAPKWPLGHHWAWEAAPHEELSGKVLGGWPCPPPHVCPGTLPGFSESQTRQVWWPNSALPEFSRWCGEGAPQLLGEGQVGTWPPSPEALGPHGVPLSLQSSGLAGRRGWDCRRGECGCSGPEWPGGTTGATWGPILKEVHLGVLCSPCAGATRVERQPRAVHSVSQSLLPGARTQPPAPSSLRRRGLGLPLPWALPGHML